LNSSKDVEAQITSRKETMSDWNPIEAKRTKYTKAELSDLFKGKGSGAVLMELKRENPALYQDMRAQAMVHGIIGPSAFLPAAPNVPYQPPTRRYSDRELLLRGRYSEQRCRELFASGDSREAQKLHKDDPDEYAAAKDAAISFGILPARTTPYVPAPKPAPVEPGFMKLSESMAADANLPAGALVTIEQFAQLAIQGIQRRAQAEQARQDQANEGQ
jgi:hypothetical protein